MSDRARMIMRNRNKQLMKKRMGQLIDQVRGTGARREQHVIRRCTQGRVHSAVCSLYPPVCMRALGGAGREGEAGQGHASAHPCGAQLAPPSVSREGAAHDVAVSQGAH